MKNINQGSTRDGFAQGLLELGKSNPTVVVISADLDDSTRVAQFRDQYPERFFEAGVAEENMVGIATGLAMTGKTAFASSYATFLINNGMGPIRSAVCYSNVNVKLIGHHTGFSASQDGATHQALEDIALTRVLPNMTVVVPCDQEEARKATLAIAEQTGPCYLRLGKTPTMKITNRTTPFTIGHANIIKEGSEVTIVACGKMVAEAIKASQVLAPQYSIEIINMHTIKPLDKKTLLKSIEKTGAVLSIEEHQQIGGLGSAIAEVIAQHQQCIPYKIMGVADHFGESGTNQELLKKHHLLAEDIVLAVKKLMKKKVKFGSEDSSRSHDQQL